MTPFGGQAELEQMRLELQRLADTQADVSAAVRCADETRAVTTRGVHTVSTQFLQYSFKLKSRDLTTTVKNKVRCRVFPRLRVTCTVSGGYPEYPDPPALTVF